MNNEIRPRHPLIVLVWGMGVLIAMNLQRYMGAIVGSAVTGHSLGQIVSGKVDDLALSFTQGVVSLIVGVPLGLLALQYLWRRPFEWMRLQFSGSCALIGLSLGFLLPVMVLAIVSAFADVSATATPSRLTTGEILQTIAASLFFMTFIAFSEETVFRGIFVREWAGKWGWLTATILGGLLFGALHIPGMDGEAVVQSIIMVLVAGIAVTALFVALYMRSRSLWLPIGFHAGWNFCLQGFLGITISGKEPGFSVYNHAVSGSDWVTGGQFGIEASVVATAIYLITAWGVLRCPWRGKPLSLDSHLPSGEST